VRSRNFASALKSGQRTLLLCGNGRIGFANLGVVAYWAPDLPRTGDAASVAARYWQWQTAWRSRSSTPPYISTSRPTSTTWATGTPKYAAGRLALRCIAANKDFLQIAMPDTLLLGITITRLK